MITTNEKKALTYNDLAKAYDAERGGDTARKYEISTIVKWAESRQDKFIVSEDGSFFFK